MSISSNIYRTKVGQNVPRELGNPLIFWYDAASMAMTDADPISILKDQSGNSFDMSSTTTARPLWKRNVKNGLPGILFDGSTSIFAMAGDNDGIDQLLSSTSITFFAVFNSGTTASILSLFGKDSSVVGGPALYLKRINASDYRVAFYNDASDKSLSSERYGNVNVISTPTISTVQFTQGSTHVIHTNNTLNSLTTVSSGTGVYTGNNQVGTLGKINVGGSFFSGYIFEIGCFVGTLTEAQRGTLTQYLSTKWGITIA